MVCFNSGEDYVHAFQKLFLSHILNGKLEINGIIYSSDCLAQHIRNILTEFDIHVPEDMQIIVFDGTYQFDGELPYCSTIVQPVQQIAEACIDPLLKPNASL